MKRKNDTNWYVITGAPSSGKTTILEKLEEQKFHVEYEMARKHIDAEIKKGRQIEEIRADELAFQKTVLQLKIKFEKELPKDQLIFMERGMHDSIAYYTLCGVEHDPFLDKAIKKSIYKKVFLLDPLPFEKDYARVEAMEEIRKLDHLLEKSYTNSGIEVIRVPKLSLDKRITFILERIDLNL